MAAMWPWYVYDGWSVLPRTAGVKLGVLHQYGDRQNELTSGQTETIFYYPMYLTGFQLSIACGQDVKKGIFIYHNNGFVICLNTHKTCTMIPKIHLKTTIALAIYCLINGNWIISNIMFYYEKYSEHFKNTNRLIPIGVGLGWGVGSPWRPLLGLLVKNYSVSG